MKSKQNNTENLHPFNHENLPVHFLFVQLGSPESPQIKDVRKFLKNFTGQFGFPGSVMSVVRAAKRYIYQI